MSTITEIVSNFHSLDGTTIQEKRRNFNYFLTALKANVSDVQQLTTIARGITPNNALEETFRIEFIIHCQLYDVLLDELKTNNYLLSRKVVKHWRVFGELFSRTSPHIFVEDILCNVSYRVKLILLNGISKFVKDENLLDRYFLAIENKYGLKLALVLLPGCTSSLVKTTLEKYYVRLSQRHLISMFKKDKEIFLDYLHIFHKKEKDHNVLYFYKNALREYAKLYPETYWLVNDKYTLHLTFGRRMTPKMFRSHTEVIKDERSFFYCFNLQRLYKTTKKDGTLKDFIVRLCPENHTDFPSLLTLCMTSNFLKLIQPLERYNVITSAFTEKYGLNLLDFPDYCKEEFVSVIPFQKREAILNTLLRTDDRLMYLYEPSKSIPMIKDKLLHSSDASSRGKLVGLLYQACSVNKDNDALTEVLQYLLKRHKNDINVLNVFLNNFLYWPNLEKLNEDAWRSVSDIVKILDMSKTNFYIDNFYGKYLSYIYEHNKPSEEHVKAVIKYLINYHSGASVESVPIKKKYKKRYFEEIGKYLHTFKDHKNYQTVTLYFMHAITNFNHQNRSHQISLHGYSNLFDQIRTIDCYFSECLIKYGLKYEQSEVWHELFWKHSKSIRDNATLLWYIRKWPRKASDNIDIILKELNLVGITPLIRNAKRYLTTDALEKLKTHASNSLDNADYKVLKLAIVILSILAPKTVLGFVQPLLATADTKMDVDETMQEVLRRKLSIKHLHRTGSASEVFPMIPKCCTEQYFRSALVPLCSVTYNTPEKQVKDQLLEFTNRGIGVRKQVLILGKHLLPTEHFARILQEFIETETNTSIKNTILEKTFRYLIENPSEFLWSLLKRCITSMDKNNRDMYNLLSKVDNVPQQYLPEYIPLIFEQISNNPNEDISRKKFQFLDAIPPQAIKDLSVEFLKRIIRETTFLKGTLNFHWKCVFYTSGKKQEELFEENFKVLKDFLQENHSTLKRDIKLRSVISSFATRFIDIALDLKQSVSLMQRFTLVWSSIIHPLTNFCADSISVALTNVYFKSNFDAYQMGVGTNELLQHYIKEMNVSIIPSFSKQLNAFLKKISVTKRNEILRFIEGLCSSAYDRHDENIYLFVIDILSAIQYDHPDYSSVLNRIKKCETPTVKYHLDAYLYSGGYVENQG